MIRGMTGFGHAAVSSGRFKALVEIRSTNHRFLDLVFYLPSGFGSIEDKLREILKRDLHRGRVSLSVKITGQPDPDVRINESVVKRYLQYERTLRRRYRLEGALALSDIIRLPGVVETQATSWHTETVWPVLKKGVIRALKGFLAMRAREGRSLASDIRGILTKMHGRLRIITTRASRILSQKKRLLSDEEFASFRKGIDINEELSRMRHYVTECRGLLRGAGGGAGKKIDFIAQEMQRETNTMGSKLQDKTVSGAVIALKGDIEKLREQAQNIE